MKNRRSYTVNLYYIYRDNCDRNLRRRLFAKYGGCAPDEGARGEEDLCLSAAELEIQQLRELVAGTATGD